MRLPRDVSGPRLVTLFQRLGYEVTRQSGSHIRLTRITPDGASHITVPAHRSLKVGLLAAIVTEVASQLDRDREELAEELFG